MAEGALIRREWLQELAPNLARLRCRYGRHGRRIVEYTVQLEVPIEDSWRAVVRFDNGDAVAPEESCEGPPHAGVVVDEQDRLSCRSHLHEYSSNSRSSSTARRAQFLNTGVRIRALRALALTRC